MLKELLAKSIRPGQEPKTLLCHTRDVLEAVERLFGKPGNPTRLGRAWMRFFGLSEADFERFVRHLRIAALFHDLGKANDGFQDEVRNEGSQVIRHEYLSALIMADRAIDSWLRSAGLDVTVVLASVLSHHVKAGEKSFGELLPVARSVVRIDADHSEFKALWTLIQGEVKGEEEDHNPFPSTFPRRLDAEEIQRRVEATKTVLRKERSRLRDDRQRRKLLTAVRAGLIVADSVGSAVIRLDKPISFWVDEVFRPHITGQEVQTDIIDRRIDQLRSLGRWNEGKGLSRFQREIIGQGPRVLLTTPCGSGKTLAAWNWIKDQVDQNPAARVLFLYPTRATATEGFRDYVSWAPETDAALASGTAQYDLQGMFTTPDDERQGRNYLTDPRLFALGLWGKRYFAATADQFFPFLQYSYGPLCLLPVLAEAVVVVDEVHSFDRSMFASLKRFLKEFQVPVLCMTATLPGQRREDLVGECGLKAFPDEPLDDLDKVAKTDRYEIEWVERDQVDALVGAALGRKQRVLWIVNRVADCQQTFVRLRLGSPGDPVYCYHSRYRLEDRRQRHNTLVREFQEAARDPGTPTPILGISTQVCEMSLDLDADLIVTEVAPIASLIQRMGRCNRKWPIPPGRIGRVCVIRPENGKEKPYEKADLVAAARFIDTLVGRPVSQDDLEAAYKKHDPEVVEPDRHCPFLDSGPFAEAGEESFRDIDEFTVPCVLDDELPKVVEALKKQPRQPIEGFIVPVPKRLADTSTRPSERGFPRWVSIAPATHYDPLSGFHDSPLGADNQGHST